MKRLSLHLVATLSAPVLTLCLATGCAPQVPAGGAPADSTSAGAASNGSAASSTSTVGGTDASPTSAPGGFSTNSPANTVDPLLEWFADDEGVAKLVSSMERGELPTSANVLYDQMGSLPDVEVSDPATIHRIYEYVSAISVAGESGYSVTDSYHHVFFTLADGTRVGFSFEGEGNLVGPGGTNYYVVGDGPLWSYVRELQGVERDGRPRYRISFEGDDDLVSSIPSSAREGDTVSFAVGFATDVFFEVYLDGELMQPVPGIASLYAFSMPDHDVRLELVQTDAYGGA